MEEPLRCQWMFCPKDALPDSIFCAIHVNGPLGLDGPGGPGGPGGWFLDFLNKVAPSVAAGLLLKIITGLFGASNISTQQQAALNSIAAGDKNVTADQLFGGIDNSRIALATKQVLYISRQYVTPADLMQRAVLVEDQSDQGKQAPGDIVRERKGNPEATTASEDYIGHKDEEASS